MSVSVKKISDDTLFSFNCAQWSLMSPANQAEWEVLENTCGLVTLLFNPYAASEFFYTLDGRVAADTPLQIVTLAGISTINFQDQEAGTVLAGPITGADAYPTFRPLELSDLPFPLGTAQGQILRWNHTLGEWEVYSGTTDGHVLTWDPTNGWQAEAGGGGGGFYQTYRDNGAAETQRANANFISSGRVSFTLTDDAGNDETEIVADIVTNSIGNTHIRQGAAYSVIGRSAGTGGDVADIVAGTVGHVLKRGDAVMEFGTVGTDSITDNAITDAKLRDSAAYSVIGRSANTPGDPADIVAGTDAHVLRRSGTSLGFGQVATNGIADDAVTYAKLQNVVDNNRVLGRVSGANGVVQELTAAQMQTLLGFIDGALTSPRIPYASDANTLTDSGSLRWLNGTEEILVGNGTSRDARFSHNFTATIPFAEVLHAEGSVSGDYQAIIKNTRKFLNQGRAIMILEVGGTAGSDAFYVARIAGGDQWSWGLDNSDNDKWKLTPKSTGPGSVANSGIIVTSEAVAKVGINLDAPAHPLDVAGVTRAVQFRNTGNLYTSGNVAFGTGAGTGPTIGSISGGNNFLQFNFNTGTAPANNGNIFTITYPNAYGTISYVTFSPRGDPGGINAATDITKFFISAAGTNSFTMKANGTLSASTAYTFSFIVGGY
jgi:hypothetical protein